MARKGAVTLDFKRNYKVHSTDIFLQAIKLVPRMFDLHGKLFTSSRNLMISTIIVSLILFTFVFTYFLSSYMEKNTEFDTKKTADIGNKHSYQA